jgi:ABC-2 type transport system permease protein
MLLSQPVSRLQVLYSQCLVTVTAIVLLALGAWLGTVAGIHTCSVKEEAPRKSLFIPLLEWRVPLSTDAPQVVRVPMRERVNPPDFLAGAANLGCLGICLAGISTLVSSWERYRWRTIGAIVGIYVISLVLKIVALAFDGYEWLSYLSLFTAYEPQWLIMVAANQPEHLWSLLMPSAGKTDDGAFVLGPAGHCLVLLAIGGVAYLSAGIVFYRRDLPAPL